MGGPGKKYWRTLVELIRFYTDCSCVGIRILNHDKDIPYEEYVGFTRGFWESENSISLNNDQCICTRVFTGNWLRHDLEFVTEYESFYCNDTASLVNNLDKEQLRTYRGTCIEAGYRTVAVIPIKYQETVLGAIHIADQSDNKLSYKTIRFIETMSVYIGEALHSLILNKRLRKAEQDILIKNIVNQVTVESMPGLVILTNKQCEILTVNGLGEKSGFQENSKCFVAFGNSEQCQWCKLTLALESRKPQYGQIESNGLLYELTWIPISPQLCLHLVCDITERKQMENEIAKLDRLNLVGEMSAGIGHEIRNPLTAVRGFLQLLSGKEWNETNKEYYSIMIEELDRANSIITEFLSLAKDRPIQFQAVSLNEVVDALYPLLNVDALNQEKRIVLEKQKVSQISGDAGEIRQLILNLVLNGLEAMNAGGMLTVGTYTYNDEAVIFIKDEGEGIDPDILDKLGNPFVTTKANGTGMGLAVCYSIANRHKANIDFQTGKTGTTFYIRFKIKK